MIEIKGARLIFKASARQMGLVPSALLSCILLHLLFNQIEFAKPQHFGRAELLIQGRWRGGGVS